MYIRSFIKVIVPLVLCILLYLGVDYLLADSLSGVHMLAFIVVIVLVLVFNRIPAHYSERYLERLNPFKKDKCKKLLQALLNSLEGNLRYQEVKKLLFEVFEKLLPGVPQVFYVWDSGLYYLSHYQHMDEDVELPVSIEPEFFNNHPQVDRFKINKSVALPDEKREAFKSLNLSDVYVFYGHNQAIAFLLTTPDNRKRLDSNQLKRILTRVQRKTGMMLENTGLMIDLEKRDAETRKLIEVSQKVLSSLEIYETLDYILDALSSLVPYDAAAIFLLDEDGKFLKSFNSRGYNDGNSDILELKVGPGSAAGYVVQTKKIDVIQNVKKATHYCAARKETRSQIAVPFLYDGGVLGVLTVESDEEEFFIPNEIELIQMFANLVAVAIYNARQVEMRLAKKALEMELINAATVQQGLLLQSFQQIKNLSYTAENVPSKIVSGDLFDFQKLNEHTLALAIADVAGKGAPAALMMTLVLAGFRTQDKKDSSPGEVVSRMNDLLTLTTIEGNFTTFFYACIDTEKDKILYSNAGHNPPFIVKKDGSVHYLEEGGIPIGFMEEQSYKQGEADFVAEDIFVAFTDGVTETMDSNEKEFGEKRIIETVRKNRHKAVDEIKKNLKEALGSFSEFRANKDDLTIILAKHE